MRTICVDDERLLMEDTVSMCLELPEIDEAKGFVRAKDALAWLEDNTADLALLDIDMPGMNGMELAAHIKARYPKTAIIFLTGYSRYAVDAFRLRVSGYLLKPVDPGQLAEEVEYAFAGRQNTQRAHIEARTFGNFDLLVDGKPVPFKQAKCKELLAYLIDRQGGSATRAEAFAMLYEDRMYDRPMQKQFDVIIRSLRDTLEEHKISEILEMKRGTLRVVPELISCDAWRFFSGDADAVNAYRGEYMSAYSWAEETESFLSQKTDLY
jgi:two-component SAPR family response regulator